MRSFIDGALRCLDKIASFLLSKHSLSQAASIANLWDDTDYWQKRLGDIEVWNAIAHSGAETDFFAYELDLFLNSDAGKSWLKPDDTVRIDNWNDDPIMLWFDDYCYKQGHDCTGILLDGIGAGGAAAVAIACIPGFAVCGTVAAVGGGIGIVSGGVGVAWTANQVYQGNATKEDLIVSTTTFVIGSVGPIGRIVSSRAIATVGMGVSAVQLIWDLWGSPQNSHRYAPYHE